MTLEAFRQWGHQAVDWVARYMEEVEGYPVRSSVAPGEIYAALPDEPPQDGEPFDAILSDLDRIIMPGITHWQSPNFFGYFPANASGPAIIGELLSAGLGVQGMLWATSPACTELETRVLDWLVGMLGLPDSFHSTSTGGGVIQDTASSATLVALLAARERHTGGATNRTGVNRPLTVYGSAQTHSSLEKAVRIAGLGSNQLRTIAVDESFAMRPEVLEQAIVADQQAQREPCFVCATVGTTSANAIDPVRAIGELCQRHGLWLHVDAAMSGTAALCPELAETIHDGVELADSYCFNPHKWMFTNFDCDCFWVADRKVLIQALTILPEYLRNEASESGAVFDYRDWQVPLGRRFRALKLWLVIRHYGVAGLQLHIRRHVALAQQLASWIEADDRFALTMEPPLNLVCFRHREGDEKNQRIMDTLNASGKLFLTHTKLAGQLTLRLSIGGTWTEERHVRAAWEAIVSLA
ncbi:MAG: aspartate aminotransferase family protein [Deltaproteobacteria bacterium]|nr:aspartate aminotransferase family protein [Deltaproteobacteria bacterium]